MVILKIIKISSKVYSRFKKNKPVYWDSCVYKNKIIVLLPISRQ